jgi:preprotein translocase subunit YajC
MKQNQIITLVLVAVVFAGVGFFGGTKYQQSQTQSQRGQLAGQLGNRGTPGAANGMGRTGGFRGGQILGDIMSVDNNSITIKLADGSSKIILLSNTTSINQASIATITDLKVGEKVAAFGTANSDGSVTAQNVQINPIMRGGPNDNNAPTTAPTK